MKVQQGLTIRLKPGRGRGQEGLAGGHRQPSDQAVVATTGRAVSSGSSGSGGIPKTAASPFSRRNYSNNKDLRTNSEKN